MMVDFKEKFGRLRKPAAAPGSTVETAPQQNRDRDAPATSRGGRFAGLVDLNAGSFNDVPAAAVSDDSDVPWFDDLPAAPKASSLLLTQPRPEGGVQCRDLSPRSEERRVRTPEPQPIEWDDPTRPAGSSYSAEEWLAAEDDGKNVVFEMVKPDEIGLCAIPAEAMNAVEKILYARSLIVSEDVLHAERWPVHASIIHRDDVLGQRGVMRYRLVRSEEAMRANPHYNGSTLRNDVEVAFQAAKQAQEPRTRFGNFRR